MSLFSYQNFDQSYHSDNASDVNFENDDLITFEHNSKTINLYYSQLTKYSKNVREKYLFTEVINHLPQDIHNFQEKSQILPENIDYFFQLLQQNYDINEDSTLTYIQCIDLLKISKFLEVRKLTYQIIQYIKSRSIDVDFIIQMIEYEQKIRAGTNDVQFEISNDIEHLLANKVSECFSNEKFKELPIEIIYRIIKQCPPNSINNNKLFDIILKSLSKFCILFQFLDLQKLSDDRLEELCEMHSKSNENTQQYFDYLKCNLNLINEISNRKKNLQEMNNQQQNKVKDLESKITSLQDQLNDSKNSNDQQQNKVKDLESKITSLQNQLNDSKSLNNEQQNKVSDLESKITQLQNQFRDSVAANDQLKDQLNDSKSLNNEQQNKMKDLENQITQLQNKLTSYNKQLDQLFQIKGKIVASIENGVLINAEIDLICLTLDTTKSKVIVSKSNAQCLGSDAYEKGEPITSLHMKKSFTCDAGTYYVRCIVFNSNGESIEIVSNSVGITEIAFSNNNLKGIFNYLKSHSNINDEVAVTRSSIYNQGNVDKLLDIEQTGKNWFSTKNEQNSWISFEFKKHKINPSHYTLKSIDVSPNDRHPKNWVIEGSSDGKDWVKLDEKSDCLLLNGNSIIKTFQISKQNGNESKKYYKYLRFKQKGPNCLGDFYLYICSIEFYGELF